MLAGQASIGSTTRRPPSKAAKSFEACNLGGLVRVCKKLARHFDDRRRWCQLHELERKLGAAEVGDLVEEATELRFDVELARAVIPPRSIFNLLLSNHFT